MLKGCETGKMITHNMLVDVIFDANYLVTCGGRCNSRIPCEECCDRVVTEYEDSIRKEAVRKFVEWLVEKGGFQTAKIETIDGRKFDNYGQFWLAEYEKEQTK